MQHISHYIDSFFERLDSAYSNGETVGIPTGFTSLDNLTSGLQRSDLVAIAARPGIGKTALCLAMAANAATLSGKGIAFFSLEVPADRLVRRLIASMTGINLQRLQLGDLDDDEWPIVSKAVHDLMNLPIDVDDSSAIEINELFTKVRKLKREKQIDMVVIDSIQKIRGDNAEDRTDETTTIPRALKHIARELDIPVIVSCKLPEAQRMGRKYPPILSDLLNSYSLEQDADVVMFIHRDRDDNHADSAREPIESVHIHVAKHRNGPIGAITLGFDSSGAHFVDPETVHVLRQTGEKDAKY